MTEDELEAVANAMRDQRDQIREELEAAGVDVTEWRTRPETDADPDAERETAGSD